MLAPDEKPQGGRPSGMDRAWAGRMIEALNRAQGKKDTYEVKRLRKLCEAHDLRIQLDFSKWIYDKRDGKATQPISGDVDAAPIQFEHTIKFGNGNDPNKP
jgi:hypothetical protein